MADYLVKSIDQTQNFRLLILNAKDLITESIAHRQLQNGSLQSLGETLIATNLLAAASLTEGEELTVRIQTDSQLQNIVATAKADGTVKGYVTNPDVVLPVNDQGQLKLAGQLGEGQLIVTKDLGLKEPFTGQTPLLPLSLAENFVYYLSTSEQINSSMGIVLQLAPNGQPLLAGGFLLQAMPGATERQLTALEENLKNLDLKQLFSAQATPQVIADKLLNGPAKILETSQPLFYCDCSKEKFGDIIATLSRFDLQQMITEDHGAEANCKFCGKSYHFSEEDLQAMLDHKE